MRRLAFAGLVSALLLLVAVPSTVTATPERPDSRQRPAPSADASTGPSARSHSEARRVGRPRSWTWDHGSSSRGPAIQVAYSDPSVLGQAPILIASLAGYFTAAGLEEVTIIEVPDPLAAARDGDVDFAIVDTSDAAEAAAS